MGNTGNIKLGRNKKLLFSLTKDDFLVDTFRSGGKGGQNQNKVESGVRITHPASGAVGEGREHRDQRQNKKAAFERMTKTKEFKAWHVIKCASLIQGIMNIDREIDEAMQPKNLKIEYF